MVIQCINRAWETMYIGEVIAGGEDTQVDTQVVLEVYLNRVHHHHFYFYGYETSLLLMLPTTIS
jgi:hypothetical protein